MLPGAVVRKVPADRLRDFIQEAFGKVGCREREALEAADVLMWASLRGVDTQITANMNSTAGCSTDFASGIASRPR